jgi:hypothetical protein
MIDLPATNKKNDKSAQIPPRDAMGRFSSTVKNTNRPVKSGNSSINQQDDVENSSEDQVFPAGGVNKESFPNIESIYLEEAEKTKELQEQLADLEKSTEVKEIKGEIELPEMVQKQGVEVVGESVPVSPQNNIVLPLDDSKIYKIIKNIKNFHQDIKSSVTWLALWCFRQLSLLHIKLKEVGGKVIREETGR